MPLKEVCKIDDIPEQGMREFDIDGVRILLIRTNDKLFALPPLCPHMEEPLIAGLCDGMSLICLKHLWQWDLDTGDPVGEAETPLLKYEVKVDAEGTIQLQFDKELLYDYQK